MFQRPFSAKPQANLVPFWWILKVAFTVSTALLGQAPSKPYFMPLFEEQHGDPVSTALLGQAPSKLLPS